MSDDIKYVQRGWHGYRRLLVANNVSAPVREQIKQAYFAGASTTFYTMMLMLDPGTDATDADIERINALQREIDEFARQIDEKYLGAFSEIYSRQVH